MNCQQEFIEEIEGKDVLCAHLLCGKRKFRLPLGHTQEQFENFCASLDFEYDDGYGAQELFGLIWYADGSWSERFEYDGSEYWVHKSCPEIPNSLKGATSCLPGA